MSYASWKRYESEERWTSYYTQINEVLGRSPDSVLEIGVGNGIVSDALKRQGIQVQTLDIDPELKPDFVGSVSQIPLANASVDVALCAEVLEHLPFEEFEGCVQELARVSRNGVVLSLPHWGYTFRGVVDIPGLPMFRAAWKLPFQKPIPLGGVHCWEIGRTGYPLSRILTVLEKSFIVEREWLSSWMPYHHFFRLKKKSL
ncbi:class I SAM-dependent methyltransferase [Patescibacteria group bacterium]|nr:class I SAM-dependent methyltransferase [Patescibacteria group bacterium]